MTDANHFAEAMEPIGSPAAPLVSVAILTFNHELFIAQAINSVLEQRTTFAIEILIADDCSTDKTRAIVESIQQKNPNRLNLLPRMVNLGLSRNLQDCRERAAGRYLAILEGDDYWTDPLKLEKQVQLMESHPDWTMSFHSCRMFCDDRSKPDCILPAVPPTRPLDVYDLIKDNLVPSMSVAMFRQGVVKRVPDWHAKFRNGDWALYILHADKGPVGFLPDQMSSYRLHSRGLWSSWNSFDRWLQILDSLNCLDEHFSGRYSVEIEQSRQNFIAYMRQRVDSLEKIERRYHSLYLDRIAGFFKNLKKLVRPDRKC